MKSIAFAVLALAASAQAIMGPDGYKDCRGCTNAGLTWQEEAKQCTANCDIQDISCVRQSSRCPPQIAQEWPQYGNCFDCVGAGYKWSAGRCTRQCAADAPCATRPSQCNPKPQPPSKPCDCYVDVTKVPKYRYNYILMWKDRPCGYSLGALYQGRCLYYAKRNSYGKVWPANCGSGTFDYIKMKTASGKSTGWVASDFLVCRRPNNDNYPRPPPAAPASYAGPSDDLKVLN